MDISYFAISEAAQRIGVSTKTLRKWDKDGILVPSHKIGKHRRYTLAQIENCKNNFNPNTTVEYLTKDDVSLFKRLAGTKAKITLRLVDDLKTRYDCVFNRLIEVYCRVYSKMKDIEYHTQRYVLCSPDVVELLAAVKGWEDRKLDSAISYMGSMGYFRIYRCDHLDEETMILGVIVDGTIDTTSQGMALFEIKNVVLL